MRIIGDVTTTIWFHLLLNNVLRTLSNYTYTKIERLHILNPNGYDFILLSAWIQLIFHFTTSSDFKKLRAPDSKFYISIIRYVIARVFCCNSVFCVQEYNGKYKDATKLSLSSSGQNMTATDITFVKIGTAVSKPFHNSVFK